MDRCKLLNFNRLTRWRHDMTSWRQSPSNAYILACSYARKEIFLFLMAFEFLSVKSSIVFCMSHTETFITGMYRHDVTKHTLMTVLSYLILYR